MDRDELTESINVNEKLEQYFHDHGKLFRLPNEINGAIMAASASFAADLAVKMYEAGRRAERERILETLDALLRTQNKYELI